MKLAIHLHLGGLSLSNTISVLDSFGFTRARSTVHNWVQKADLEPAAGRDPDMIALDETVVKVEGERFWVYSAVDADTNGILHLKLYPTRNLALTKMFLREVNYPCLLAAVGGSLRQGLPVSTTRFGEIGVFSPGSAVSAGVDSAMP
jgi:transposase-like protein